MGSLVHMSPTGCRGTGLQAAVGAPTANGVAELQGESTLSYSLAMFQPGRLPRQSFMSTCYPPVSKQH